MKLLFQSHICGGVFWITMENTFVTVGQGPKDLRNTSSGTSCHNQNLLEARFSPPQVAATYGASYPNTCVPYWIPTQQWHFTVLSSLTRKQSFSFSCRVEKLSWFFCNKNVPKIRLQKIDHHRPFEVSNYSQRRVYNINSTIFYMIENNKAYFNIWYSNRGLQRSKFWGM